MNRWQLFLSTAKAALAAAFGGSWMSGKARAQTGGSAPTAASEGVIHGTLGSPDATISLDGRVLPPPPPAFGGVIKNSYKGLHALVAAALGASLGRPKRVADHDRRPGLRHQQHVRGCHPDADAGPRGERRAALHGIQLHRALLADARRFDYRPQPPRGRALA